MKLKSKVIAEKDVERIVVLNSGGFDSVVLMNCLNLTEPEAELHSIHFHYGARNEAQQQKCVDKVCEKCHAVNKVIDLPEFSWTKGEFYQKGYAYNTQYLEYRNLVFLAYAISYAQSIGAKKIYLAVLADGQYNDTNMNFMKGLNSAIKESGIQIITPFDKLYKLDLLTYAVQSKMTTEDYFSCDDPDEEGNPCGVCLDCCALDEINKVLTVDHPMKAFYRGGYDFSNTRFKELLSARPLEEVRALINNDCQLKCKHCFYGFDSMIDEPLSKEEYYEVLKELVLEYGAKNIHFSGKEPLFDDSILWYAEQMKKDKLPCTFNLVTNGINVPKYAKQLKKAGIERICLSVDDVLNTNGVRSVHDVTDKAMVACNKAGIPVEVFIDLHENNYGEISEIIAYLEKHYKVIKYYVRTIRSLGNAEDQKLLGAEQLDYVFMQLQECAEKYTRKDFAFSISIEYLDILEDTKHLNEAIQDCEDEYTDMYMDNFSLKAEEFCSRYSGTLTLTPDGYFLGCASEVSCPNYDKVSVGNVRENSVKELMNRGREESYSCNDHFIGKEKLECSCKFFS